MAYYRHEMIHVSLIRGRTNEYRLFSNAFNDIKIHAPQALQSLFVGPIDSGSSSYFTLYPDGAAEDAHGRSIMNDTGVFLRHELLKICSIMGTTIVYVAYGDAGSIALKLYTFQGEYYASGTEKSLGNSPLAYIADRIFAFDTTTIHKDLAALYSDCMSRAD